MKPSECPQSKGEMGMRAEPTQDEKGGGGQGGTQGPIQAMPLCSTCRQVPALPGLFVHLGGMRAGCLNWHSAILLYGTAEESTTQRLEVRNWHLSSKAWFFLSESATGGDCCCLSQSSDRTWSLGTRAQLPCPTNFRVFLSQASMKPVPDIQVLHCGFPVWPQQAECGYQCLEVSEWGRGWGESESDTQQGSKSCRLLHWAGVHTSLQTRAKSLGLLHQDQSMGRIMYGF